MNGPEVVIAERLSRFPEVERVILFGSRARGDAGFRADIDLAVECPTADILRWSDIEEVVEESPTLLMIDLVRLDTAPAEFAAVIREEGRVLYDRAKRRLESLAGAVARLQDAIAESASAPFVIDATIRRFRFAFELCWKAMKAALELQTSAAGLGTARGVIKAAYAAGWIADENGWVELLKMRNATSHVYNEAAAREIYGRIKLRAPLMRAALESLRGQLP